MPMAQHVPAVPCECGGTATQVFNADVQVVAKGNQRPFKLDGTCVPIGWERGNTDAEQQQRRYEHIVARDKKAAQENDKQAIKNGIRLIAKVPRELERMRSNQYGAGYFDPTQNTRAELVEKLKADDLYMHRD